MNLKNKVAIVTGTSKGLGFSIAEQLLFEGAIVVGLSRSKTLIDHPHFEGYQVDISYETDVLETYEKVISKYGRVDILVNNAGFGSYDKLEETDSHLMRKMFEVNVFGIFYLTKCAVPTMKKSGKGHIVNISSIAGIMGIENMSVYNGTKYAVKGMSDSLYKELRPHGIKVSCIMPGSIGTDFFDDFEGYTTGNTMMHPNDVANSILHILLSPASYHPVNLEIRPFNQQ